MHTDPTHVSKERSLSETGLINAHVMSTGTSLLKVTFKAAQTSLCRYMAMASSSGKQNASSVLSKV